MGYNCLFNNFIHSVSDSYMGLRRSGLRRAKTIRYNMCVLRLLLQTRHHVDSDNGAENCTALCLCANFRVCCGICCRLRHSGWVPFLMRRRPPRSCRLRHSGWVRFLMRRSTPRSLRSRPYRHPRNCLHCQTCARPCDDRQVGLALHRDAADIRQASAWWSFDARVHGPFELAAHRLEVDADQ